MRSEERLFLAIGAADPALLERSERRRRSALRRWGGLAAAACLAVVCALAVYGSRSAAPPVPPPDITPPPEEIPAVTPLPDTVQTQPLTLTGGDIGALHLAAVRCGPAQDGNAGGFILYINEELYRGTWEGEDYVVRPQVPAPEGLPECSLTVSHRKDAALETVLAETRAALAAEFDMAEDQPAAEGRAALAAWDGDASGAAWDAASADVTLVDDRQGGAFVLTARYFTEAAEGHGARFADMVSAFRPVSPDVAVPEWMTSLRRAVDILAPAAFSGDWTPEARALLAEGASVDVYGEDVSGYVSVAGVDITADDDRSPASAVVSIRHRLGGEESMTYVTMELRYEGGRWLADFIGLEK